MLARPRYYCTREGSAQLLLPLWKTPSASRTDTSEADLTLTSSALTVTCGGLCSRSSTPTVTFAPGLMIAGAVTRNRGLKNSQEGNKHTFSFSHLHFTVTLKFHRQRNRFHILGQEQWLQLSNSMQMLLKQQQTPQINFNAITHAPLLEEGVVSFYFYVFER